MATLATMAILATMATLATLATMATRPPWPPGGPMSYLLLQILCNFKSVFSSYFFFAPYSTTYEDWNIFRCKCDFLSASSGKTA